MPISKPYTFQYTQYNDAPSIRSHSVLFNYIYQNAVAAILGFMKKESE